MKNTNLFKPQFYCLSKPKITLCFKGVNMQTLAIPGNFLLPCTEYRLVLNASYCEDEGWSIASYDFSTNFPPYGGICEFDVIEGLFTL